jgi:tetratricopeptide (TPR) repeat protein
MKGSLALLAFCLLASTAFADEFSDRFQELRKAADHKAMVKFLEESAQTQANNANYYALASNYWWSYAGTAIISTKPAGEGEFTLRKKDTGEEAGSVTDAGRLDPSLRQKALDLTTEGFKRFPERLDIGLGLASVQSRMGKTADSVETLLALLKVSKEKTATLKWGANKPLPEPAATLVPESIQGYTVPLLEAGDEASTKLCKQLSEATIATYPDHPFAYNILAALADARDDQAEVMKMLKLAHSKAPQNALILLNLADAQREAKQDKEALASYKKILELEADDELKEAAKEGIAQLEKAGK